MGLMQLSRVQPSGSRLRQARRQRRQDKAAQGRPTALRRICKFKICSGRPTDSSRRLWQGPAGWAVWIFRSLRMDCRSSTCGRLNARSCCV